MTSRYVVIDSDSMTTWSDKNDHGESFKSFKNAERRAQEVARDEPGKSVGIYERIASVIVEIGAPRTISVSKAKK